MVTNFQELLEREMEEYFQTCDATIDDIIRRSRIKYNPSTADREMDIFNIDFPDESEEAMERLYFFSSLLTEELLLGKLSIIGTIGERRERLKKQLLVEERIKLIKQAIQ